MSDDAPQAPQLPGKVVQAHGGALYAGGVPGNNGGRPPSAIRATARESLDKLMPRLNTIAKARKSKDSDKIRAIEVLAKIGMDRAVSIEDVKEALRETTREIYEFLPRDQADALVARVRPIWRKL